MAESSSLHLLDLPVDMLCKIFNYLDVSDILNLMLTCQGLKTLVINENRIWRNFYKNYLVIHNSQLETMAMYHRYRISFNWRKGYFKRRVLLYNQTKYMPWIRYYNFDTLVVAFGSSLVAYPSDRKSFPDCKQQLWKIEVPKKKRHDIRTNDISRFIINNGLIVCGNRDGCVAVYRSDYTLTNRPQLISHIEDCHQYGSVEVTAVAMAGSRVITASMNDSCVKLWSSFTNDGNDDNDSLYKTWIEPCVADIVQEIQLQKLPGARCLSVNNDFLAIGPEGDSKPLVVDVQTGQYVILNEHRDYKQTVRDIYWHNDNMLAFITHTGDLRIADIRAQQSIFFATDPFDSGLYCLRTDCDRAVVVGASEHSRCTLFDIRMCRRHVQTYFTHRNSSPVYSLDFDATKLISATDRTLASVHFNVNNTTVPMRDYSHEFMFA